MQTKRFLPSFLNFCKSCEWFSSKLKIFAKNLILLLKKLKHFAKKLKEIAEKLNGPVVSTTCANRKSAQKKSLLRLVRRSQVEAVAKRVCHH